MRTAETLKKEGRPVKMINIDRIRARYKRNPEPKEIGEVRRLITESFSKLEFVEGVHKYYVPDGNGGKTELPAVSTVVHGFEPYVDWDEKCVQKAERLGIDPDELAKQWHEKNIIATHCGSKTHFFGENAMNMFIGREDALKKNMPFQYTDDGYLIPYCGKERAITKYYEDILANEDVYPVMPEAMIYMGINDKVKVKKPYAGTFDILLGFKMGGGIKFAIHDFKTNEDIYKSFSRTYDVMMEPPFGDMGFYNEPYSCYCIQLSLYQLGLMQLDLDIVDRALIWLKEDGIYDKVRTPDLTNTLLEYV